MADSTIFALPEFKPYTNRFNARLVKFSRLRRYYDGTIYADTNFKLAHKLYAETKSLFAFLARAVDLDAALVPGVMDPWEMKDDTPAAVLDAQQTLYEWSGWATGSDDWLEDGATLGEAALKIVPQAEGRTIQMQRLKPEHLLLERQHMDMETGRRGEIGLIVDRSYTMPDGSQAEYAEVITPSQVRTYLNGVPFGFHGNPDRYENPLGFVPVVVTKNDAECRPTFAKSMAVLASVNELASYVADIIGRHAEPQYVASGVEPSELTRSGDNVWFLPAGSVEALLASIDIEGALAFIEAIKVETKSNLPELAFDDLRSKDQIATETLQVQLIELDAKIWKMRRRYDAGLVTAHMMAAIAGQIYGIRELGPLLQRHGMDYKRPVRPISRMDEIRLAEAELALEMAQAVGSGEGMTI